MKISFLLNVLEVDGHQVKLDFDIVDAVTVGDSVVVLLDVDSVASVGQFRNLVALDKRGSVIWKAEMPTSANYDRYFKIASVDPLVAYSTTSFECEIDPGSGKIVRRVYYK